MNNNIIRTVFLFFLFPFTVQAAEKVYLFTEQLPPYSMTIDGKPFAHSADNVTGLCVDIVKNVLDKTSIAYKMKLRNWSYGLSRVGRSANNGIFCTARTPEREDQFKWVGPLTEYSWTLFAKPGSTLKLKTLEDARKYKIGGYKDDFMSNFLVENKYNISVVNNDALNPHRLQMGKIDLWIADELVGPYTASDAADISDLVKVLSFRSTPMYLAINKETPDRIVAKLQKSLDRARAAGELDALERSYGR